MRLSRSRRWRSRRVWKPRARVPSRWWKMSWVRWIIWSTWRKGRRAAEGIDGEVPGAEGGELELGTAVGVEGAEGGDDVEFDGVVELEAIVGGVVEAPRARKA